MSVERMRNQQRHAWPDFIPNVIFGRQAMRGDVPTSGNAVDCLAFADNVDLRHLEVFHQPHSRSYRRGPMVQRERRSTLGMAPDHGFFRKGIHEFNVNSPNPMCGQSWVKRIAELRPPHQKSSTFRQSSIPCFSSQIGQNSPGVSPHLQQKIKLLIPPSLKCH